MNKIYLLIGGNLGTRFLNLQKTRNLIAQRIGEIEICSAIYETAAWGMEHQADFLNQVLEVVTVLSPMKLLEVIHEIEEELGRERKLKWAARTMDIDILFYGDQIISTSNLVIPHPYLHLRRFTLVPLCELQPDLRHPIFQKSIKELLLECGDELEVRLKNEEKSFD